MAGEENRRHEDRIHFYWPLWFGYEDNGELFRGKIIDLNNSHVSFSVEEQFCPPVGHHVFTRFSFPLESNDKYEMGEYLHWAEVVRVDYTGTHFRRVAMRLHQPINLIFAKEIKEGKLAQSA